MKRGVRFLTMAVSCVVIMTTVASASDAVNNPSTHNVPAGIIQLNKSYTPGSSVSLSDTYGVKGGSVMHWTHTGGASFIANGWDDVRFVKGNGFFPDGKKATILNYAIENKTRDNGYLLVAVEDTPDWVSALGGNEKYVDIYKGRSSTQLDDQFYTEEWQVDWLPDIAALSGGKIVYKGGASSAVLQVNSDGNTATELFDVIPTPPPVAAVSMDKQTYTVGDKATVDLTAKVYAAATNWHFEAVQVIGPDGKSQYLRPVTQNDGPGETAKGTGFPYYGEFGQNGFLGRVYGGGSGDPAAPAKYSETATLDTTGLTPGTYTVKYTLYDAVARAASSGTTGTVTTTFDLKPSAAGGSGGSGGTSPTPPPPPPNNYASKVLSMKWGKDLPTQVKMGNSFVAPIEISNNSDKDITTNLTFSLKGGMVQAYQISVPDTSCTDPNGCPPLHEQRFHTLPVTETVSAQVTVPKHGVYTWKVSNGLLINAQGGNPSKWTGALNVYGVTNNQMNGWYDWTADYYPYLECDAVQPALFVQPTITASVGTNFDAPQHQPVHLVR